MWLRQRKIKFDNVYGDAQTLLAEHEIDFHPRRSDHGSEEGCNSRGSHPDPPPPSSTLACPLVEVANPRYGTLLGDSHGGGRDDRPTILVYRPWTHKDRQNVILLPSIRSHVEKYWVTQDTGTVDEALQYANHAQTVVKNKEKASVFALDTDTAFTAFSGSGGYRGVFRGQRRGRGVHSGRARGRGRATHTPNSGFNTTCWRCGKEGHFVRDCKKQRRQ